MIINNPQIFISILKKVSKEYEKLTGKKIEVLNYENTFFLNIYDESINNKIENKLMFKENFKKAEINDMLNHLEEKYKDVKNVNGFAKDEEEINYFKGFEEFIVLNKSIFYLSSLVNKQNFKIEFFQENIEEKDVIEVFDTNKLFNNVLFKHILTASEDSENYGSIQLRVQDAFFLYSNIDEENLIKFLNLRVKKFHKNITVKDLMLNWSNKLSNEINHGIDWKILNNVLVSINQRLFKKQRAIDGMIIVDNIRSKQESEATINLSDISYALKGIERTLNEWKRYKGLLHYSIYEQVVEETVEMVMKFNKDSNEAKESSFEFLKVIKQLEILLKVENLNQINENKLVVHFPIKQALRSLKIQDEFLGVNALVAVNRFINLFLFSIEDNPNTLLYNCQYQIITNDKNVVLGGVYSVEYDKEFGTFSLEKLKGNFVNLIAELMKTQMKYDETSIVYKNIFGDFMKRCDEIKLENKLIEKSLKSFNEERGASNKKKI